MVNQTVLSHNGETKVPGHPSQVRPMRRIVEARQRIHLRLRRRMLWTVLLN